MGALRLQPPLRVNGGHAARAGDRETPAILKFNQMLYQTPALFVTLLPLRDGLAVCHKL